MKKKPAVKKPLCLESPEPQPLTYSIPEVAKLLGLSRAGAYAAARKNEIPTLHFGKRIVVPRAALDEMLRKAAISGKGP